MLTFTKLRQRPFLFAETVVRPVFMGRLLAFMCQPRGIFLSQGSYLYLWHVSCYLSDPHLCDLTFNLLNAADLSWMDIYVFVLVDCIVELDV